jgi:hypothetical protein
MAAGFCQQSGQHKQKQRCRPAQPALVSRECVHLCMAVIAVVLFYRY